MVKEKRPREMVMDVVEYILEYTTQKSTKETAKHTTKKMVMDPTSVEVMNEIFHKFVHT